MEKTWNENEQEESWTKTRKRMKPAFIREVFHVMFDPSLTQQERQERILDVSSNRSFL
jgi:hypothetical protein